MAIKGIEGDFAPVEPVREKKSTAPEKKTVSRDDIACFHKHNIARDNLFDGNFF